MRLHLEGCAKHEGDSGNGALGENHDFVKDVAAEKEELRRRARKRWRRKGREEDPASSTLEERNTGWNGDQRGHVGCHIYTRDGHGHPVPARSRVVLSSIVQCGSGWKVEGRARVAVASTPFQ